MKHIFSICLLLLSLSLVAQKKVTSVKFNRTACYGRCPVYSLEIFSNGKINYNGERNVAKVGSFTQKVSPQKVKKLFAFIEKNKISTLQNVYEEKASDLPRLNMAFTVNKKLKSIKNAEAGPDYLNEIATKMDAIWNELHTSEDVPPPVEEAKVEIMPVEEPKQEVFSYVEQMPEFPGGQNAMMEFINKNIKYPAVAKEEGIQGKVICNFIIQDDGNVSYVKVVRSLSKECDEEAMRVIKAMPLWKPGKQNGKAVKTYMNLPINFKLN